MNKDMMVKLAETAIIEFCRKYAERGYVINTPSVVIERLSRGAAGLACIRDNCIKLDEDYFRENSDFIIFDTIPHEIAHFIVCKHFPNAKQHHGPEFRAVMQPIGLSGSTYHSMPAPTNKPRNKVKRYEVACGCKTYFLTKAKCEKYTLIKHICNKCGKILINTGNVVSTNDPASLHKKSA